ncbi:MAG TPA: helix-turn-helix domain-containing protein [Bacteroidota bacterium]|nr:helix-turn-helix domain-containing protein [Bacteroidota bacterium]
MELESVLIGESSFIKRMRKEIPLLAKSQRPLILKGDTGTGRGLIAQLIYRELDQKGELVTVTSGLTDIEAARFVVPNSSSAAMYLMREFHELTYLQQASLARFLDQLPKKPAVQIILTTTKTLADASKDKTLHPDLSAAVKGYELIAIPPLLQRPGDIPLLVEYFLKLVAESQGIRSKIVDTNTMDFLVRREWKENVRELKRVVERAAFYSGSDYLELPESLIDEYAQLDGIIANIKLRQAFSFDRSLFNLEKTLIERTLDLVGFNQSKAAAVLKLSEANLRYRLKKFHIPTSKDHR